MRVAGLNHFNIVSNDMEKSAAFYEQFGLTRGHRPSGFSTKGIWLYVGDDPIIHINDTAEVGTIESKRGPVHHVGLTIKGDVGNVTKTLASLGVTFDLWDPIPGVCRALYFEGPSGEAVEFVLVDCHVDPVMAIPVDGSIRSAHGVA